MTLSHVVIVGGKAYAAKTGEEQAKILKRLIKEHPHEQPLITCIPQ